MLSFIAGLLPPKVPNTEQRTLAKAKLDLMGVTDATQIQDPTRLTDTNHEDYAGRKMYHHSIGKAGT